ncbi:hypothetical protein D187_002061 [Cystobacter fuscus DSM 2262]|uniref:Uncharacterized protein n=1 Tax=Cystobacter fuscus (strain ATCC 25194 / DSM 2262 / NBRC 100088 / M29) TaxID=1242864 RepID=S9P677_CYSF2|nr:hypothetical protein D187_002061 [Cystobacter fuscus DSM 2262]
MREGYSHGAGPSYKVGTPHHAMHAPADALVPPGFRRASATPRLLACEHSPNDESDSRPPGCRGCPGGRCDRRVVNARAA